MFVGAFLLRHHHARKRTQTHTHPHTNIPTRTHTRAHAYAGLVEHVERAGEEVHDELAERHAKLWQSDASEEEDLCYKTYWVAADVPITLLETRAFLSHGTTGLTSWEAAKFMTEYILNQSTLFKGKRVLELGCGVGLVAAALVKLARPQCVICTDASPLVLSLLERNLSLNNIKHAWLEDTTTEGVPPLLAFSHSSRFSLQALRCIVLVCVHVWIIWGLWWGCTALYSPTLAGTRAAHHDADAEVRLDVLDWTLASTEQLGQYAADVVVATDVMYDEAVAEPLARVLESQMSRPGTSAFIAYTLRNEDTVAAFFTALGMVLAANRGQACQGITPYLCVCVCVCAGGVMSVCVYVCMCSSAPASMSSRYTRAHIRSALREGSVLGRACISHGGSALTGCT